MADFCKHGHELTPENTYTRPGGQFECRQCKRATADQYLDIAKGRVLTINGEQATIAEFAERHGIPAAVLAHRVFRGEEIGAFILRPLGKNPPDERTHCKNGHELTTENTYRPKNGMRLCRICLAAAYARSHAKRSPIYTVWIAMKARCYNTANVAYHRYGGRGITVCDKWRHSFDAFKEDLIASYAPGMTLERIDNDGNYEPTNAKWATRLEQGRNTSINRILTIDGEAAPVSVWAERAGIKSGLIRSRIQYGWAVDRSILQQPNPHRTKHVKAGAEKPKSAPESSGQG